MVNIVQQCRYEKTMIPGKNPLVSKIISCSDQCDPPGLVVT